MKEQKYWLAFKAKHGQVVKALFPVVLGILIMMLGGCGQREQEEWVPTRTTIVVNEDGTLTETILEQLDKDYYSGEKLQQMVGSSVTEYNSEHGADAVKVDECLIENRQVKLVMTYRSGADYAAYNNVDFFNGTMLGAQMEGFRFETDFYPVEKGAISGSRISNDVPLSHKEAQVLVTDQAHAIKVPGKISYISANAQLTEDGLAVPAGVNEVSTDETGAAAADRTYTYIIYAY